MKPHFRKDIQALRGVAVMAVVFFHVSPRMFPLGYLGVDVFFVISGFVVTPLILRIFRDPNQESLKTYQRINLFDNLLKFYVRRFFRLAPALIVTLIVSAGFILLLAPVSDHQNFYSQGLYTLFLLGNVGAFKNSGDYFRPDLNPLIHTWSLSVEEQIYILLPLLMIILFAKFKNQKSAFAKIFLTLTCLSLFLFLFPNTFVTFGLGNDFVFYSPVSRLWQFTLGGLTFLISRSTHFNQFQFKIFFISLPLIFILLYSPFQIDLNISVLLSTFTAAALITIKGLELIPKFIGCTLIWIGDRSYSIYLLHMPIIYISNYQDIFDFNLWGDRILRILALVFIVLFANLMYTRVENRFRENYK